MLFLIAGFKFFPQVETEAAIEAPQELVNVEDIASKGKRADLLLLKLQG